MKVKGYYIRNVEEVVGSFYGLGWNEFVVFHTKKSERERKRLAQEVDGSFIVLY